MGETNELYHYGIKGMRWGVRRFQNKDGGLTSAGRKRYSRDADDLSEDAKAASALRKKRVDQMSNAELKKLNERMQLERNYKQLNPSSVKKGLAIAGTVIGAMGTIASLYDNGGKLIKIGTKVAGILIKR